MSSTDDDALFPGYYPSHREPEPQLSAGQRLTQRQIADITIGRHPLTRGSLHPLASRHRTSQSPKDDPFTCGSCSFRTVIQYHGRAYPKCLFDPRRGDQDTLDMYARITHGAASDVRAWWPACPEYLPGSSISADASRVLPPTEESNQ